MFFQLDKRIHEYSKEEFDAFTDDWKNERIKSIREQLRTMGASLDFKQEKFTLDDQMSRSVREAFIRLYDKGLIYRENSMVNWSFHLNSTISDIEVDWISVDKKQSFKFVDNQMNVGVLYNIEFKLEDSDERIWVATTRPYTIPGDVAVAFNSNDKRYQHLIGKRAINPLTGRLMPIITDHRVLEEFGSGLVKLTPSCSLIDFQIAQTHKLDIVEIFDSKGNLCVDSLHEEFKHLNGLNRFKANEEVLSILKQLNQLKGEVDHETRIPICSKSGDLIEYRILPQWFLNVKQANEFIKTKLESNELELIPANHKNTLLDWIKHDKPWCVSRQINWGHQIPMYKFTMANNEERWIAANSMDEAKTKFSQQYNEKALKIDREQDVLDTWFSSSLIPFCYFGWPENTEQLKNFYPLSLMETGCDILKFWVHKMLISGFYLTDQLPFKHVLLHGMIVDANGKKMSKSLGNVIDPLDFINGCTLNQLQSKLKNSFKDGYLTKEQLSIALKGQKELFPKGLPVNSADGLRLCLYQLNPKFELLRMNAQIITKNRNLINKIWQAFNFVLFIKQNLETESNIDFSLAPEFEHIEKRHLKQLDRWILSCLNRFVSESKINYENYDLYVVHRNFITFFIECYCDVYMELIKPSLYNEADQRVKLIRFSILKFCLSSLYSTIHPLLPFITEELYQKLKYLDCELYKRDYEYKSIFQSAYPDEHKLKQFADDDLEDRMSELMECVVKLRWINHVALANKFSKDNLKFKIQSTDDVILDYLDSSIDEIKLLARNSNVEVDFDTSYILDDGFSTEYIVDKTLILKVKENLQIVVDSPDFDLAEIFNKHLMELIDKQKKADQAD